MIKRIASLFNELAKSGLLAAIFTFQSNLKGIKGIFEANLKFILFPLAAATEVITTLLAFVGFIQAKNKNLGKTFDLTFSLLTTALILTAVIGGLWFGFPLLAVSGLFVSAIAVGALYNVGQFFYHAYRWLTTPASEADKKAFFRAQTLKYAITSLVGLSVVAGIVVTMMLPAAAPMMLAAAGMTTAVMLLAGAIYTLYNHFNPPSFTQGFTKNSSESESNSLINSPEQSSEKFDFYALPRIQLTENIRITENIRNDAKNFADYEEAYRAKLDADMAKTKGSKFGRCIHSVLGFYPEQAKREAKKANSQNRQQRLLLAQTNAHEDSTSFSSNNSNLSIASNVASNETVNKQSFFKKVGTNEYLDSQVQELLERIPFLRS